MLGSVFSLLKSYKDLADKFRSFPKVLKHISLNLKQENIKQFFTFYDKSPNFLGEGNFLVTAVL